MESNTNIFCQACRRNNVPEVIRMISAGVDINRGDRKYGVTGLMGAMSKSCTEIIEILLDHEDVKIDTTDTINRTALHYACNLNNIKGVKLFLKHPSCTKDIVGMKDSVYGETAEMVAERQGNECARLVRDYLEKNCDDIINVVNYNAVTKSAPSDIVFTVGEKTKAGEVSAASDERILQQDLFKRIPSLQPSCPVCFETMEPPVKIFTCGNGHLICSTCEPRVRKCFCEARYTGRATAVEQMLRELQDVSYTSTD